jgi:hypothetical protein
VKGTYRKTNASTIHRLPVLKDNALDTIVVIDFNLADTLAQHDIQTHISDLLHNQTTCVPIKLSAQYPSIALNQFDLLKLLQIHHGFRSFEA